MKILSKSGDPNVDLGQAFDASPNPYVLMTPDFEIAGANQAYLDVTNTTREAIVGRSMFAAFDAGPGEDAPENVRQLRASLEKVRETRQRDHLAVIPYSIPRKTDTGEVFEDRYWSATHTPLLNEAGEVVMILQHTTDITELELLRQQTQEAEGAAPLKALDAIVGGNILERARLVQEDNRRLSVERNRLVEMFMQAPGFVAVLSGPEHIFQFHNDAYRRLIGYRDVQGQPVAQAMPEVVSQGYVEMLDRVFRTGEPVQGSASLFQFPQEPGGPPSDAYVDFSYQPIREADGTIIGVFVQGHDVTESVLAAERQKLMIDELNHRVKNTLATVQSIAMQTARSHTDPARFAASFQARLLALSHTHDLLTRSHWEGANLRSILEHETQAHDQTRVLLNGPAVDLDSASAISLGMVFHELATNAAKYGALAAPDGKVVIDWTVTHSPTRTLNLTWQESGVQDLQPPDHRGFGSRLIERNVRHDLGGTVSMDYGSTGLIARLTLPLDRDLPA
ncbi:HWE histidine kinase domain-containing protein [Brevundimonas sp.]|uniref:sensor histidine kinase n=1 Tax=Brevundimonas sp. TaxID=1871086 RepID=UPI0025BD6F65|nr:HWE histidine kinase domain-containing protein [Brevundimonas sp.]